MLSAHDDNRKSRESQLVLLLNQVNARLLRSEKQRLETVRVLKQTRARLDTVEERADKAENAYLTLQDHIHKAESASGMIRQRQDALEKIYQSRMAKLEKAAELAGRIEEAMAQYARINRRLEQITTDRSRVNRKLERLEETITSTQEALNAKALVLLADKEQTPVPVNENTGTKAKDKEPRISMMAYGASLIAVAAAVFGIMNYTDLSFKFVGQGQDTAAFTAPSEVHYTDNSVVFKPTEPLDDLKALEDEGMDPESAITDDETDTELADNAFPTEQYKPAADKKAAVKDIEEEEFLPTPVAELSPSYMDNEASMLNQIEPAAAPIPKNVTELKRQAAKEEAAAKKAEKKVKEAEAEPTVAHTKELANIQDQVDKFLASQVTDSPVSARIRADSSLPLAIKEIENKAFRGSAEAQHDLAAIYTAGHGGVSVNYTRAAQWFREAALNGIANARYNLGVLYHQGLGVEKDVETAVQWYRAAARENHPEALYNLGIAHMEGIGTQYNPRIAAAYFEKAAEMNVYEAAYNLGLIYENGLLGARKPREAMKWYGKAASLGSTEAKAAMEELSAALKMSPSAVEESYYREKEDISTASNAAVPPVEKDYPAHTNLPIELKPSEPMPAVKTKSVESTDLLTAKPGIQEERTLISLIQEELLRRGLYPGPVNGIQNVQLEDAISAYQSQHEMDVNGEPSDSLLAHLVEGSF